MYHCRLRIAVFDENPGLAEMVRQIEPLERFDHAVERRSAKELTAVENLGLLIWNLGDGMSPGALREICGPDTVLVYCADRHWLDCGGGDEIGEADEIWELPLNFRCARQRLERLLKQIKLERDLHLCSSYLDTAIDSIPDMVWFKALDGTHVKVNKAFCSTVGKSREDVTGRDHCYIWDVSREDFERGEGVCKETEDAVIRERKTLQFTEMVKSHGSLRQFRTYKSPLFDSDGVTILGTVGIGHDVTDLVNLNTEVEILLSSMPYAILLRDNEGRILNVNKPFERYFEVRREEVLGKEYEGWISQAFFEEHSINSEGFVESKVCLNGEAGRTLEIHENNIYDIFENVVGKLSIFRDVTMERQLEEQILRNSNTDFLTGLYNRRSLYQYLHNNRNGRLLNLLYVDLDYFKHVNDTYGHKVGDDALILTAKVLRECFKNEFIARIGGDEFLIVQLGEAQREALESKAQQLLDQLSDVFGSTENMDSLSASIGIVQNGAQDKDIDLLIQQSDAALYQAKESGRGRYCIYGIS